MFAIIIMAPCFYCILLFFINHTNELKHYCYDSFQIRRRFTTGNRCLHSRQIFHLEFSRIVNFLIKCGYFSSQSEFVYRSQTDNRLIILAVIIMLEVYSKCKEHHQPIVHKMNYKCCNVDTVY